jgi:hypothetical protein
LTTVRSTAVMIVLAFAATKIAHAQNTTALLCQGSGSVLESQVSNGMEYDNKTHSYNKSTSSSTTAHRAFSGAANVEISGNGVRMQLPHELVPGINNARDGWFTLDDVFVGEKEITGTLKLNMVNRPKVRIDRMTGQLTLASGLETFNGACNKVDATAGPKF